MRRLYQMVLKLYPAEYRAAFAAEMIGVFDQASADAKQRGIFNSMCFALSEYGSLIQGSFRERTARWAAGQAYVTLRSTSPPDAGLPTEIIEAERHLEYVLRSMEFAIAHHDFPKARFYSNEEYAARARLQRLTASLSAPES